MSEQERFDWSDDAGFEDLNDDQVFSGEEVDYPVDSLSDFEDSPTFESLADDDGSADMVDDLAEPTAEISGEEEADPAPAESKQSYQSPGGISAGGLGFLFGFGVIVAMLGGVGTLAYAMKMDPLALWNPAGLTQFDQMLNFQDNPLNLMYLVVLGVVVLGFLGSWAVARAAKSANAQLAASEALLEKVASLRLGDDQAWQDARLKANPSVEAFVSETLGAYRLLQARQDRQMGLEGELHRLEKALHDDSRTDLQAKYEHPTSGALADVMLKYYDQRDAALKSAEAVKAKDTHEAENIIGIVHDACSWNRSTLDQVGVQGTALDRVAGRVNELVNGLNQASAKVAQLSESRTTIQALQKGVQLLAMPGEDEAAAEVSSELNALVDRTSKLVFQVAMEVARLGARGERLLPMTQSLEELTTEFRQTVGKLSKEKSDQPNNPEVLAKVNGYLKSLDAALAGCEGDAWRKLGVVGAEVGPAATNVVEGLTTIGRSFNNQSDRLNKLGEAFADMSGATFDPTDASVGDPDNPPEGGLNIQQHDPFAEKPIVDSKPKEVDPFAAADSILPDAGDASNDSIFSSNVTPGLDEPVAETPSVEPSVTETPDPVFQVNDPGDSTPALSMDLDDEDALPLEDFMTEAPTAAEPFGDLQLDTNEPAVTHEPTVVEEPSIVSEPAVADEPALSEEAETVYDLSDMGAVPVQETQAPAEEDEDRIHELSEFGAVSLD